MPYSDSLALLPPTANVILLLLDLAKRFDIPVLRAGKLSRNQTVRAITMMGGASSPVFVAPPPLWMHCSQSITRADVALRFKTLEYLEIFCNSMQSDT